MTMRRVLITDECMDRIVQNGSEEIRIDEDLTLLFVYDKTERSAPPPGFRGEGCYVEREK